MMAVAVSSDSGFEPSRPVKLFEGPYGEAPSGISQCYDVVPDGRFVMMRLEEGQEITEPRIHVVLIWFEELKRVVPTNN